MGAYLTDKEIYDLNNAMTANQNVQLGSLIDGVSAGHLILINSLANLVGSHTVTAGEDSGSAVILYSHSGSTIQAYNVDILVGGEDGNYLTSGITKTVSGSALTISGSSLTAGDVIYYFIV